MRYIFKDKFSGLSHLVGAFMGIAVTILLLSKSIRLNDPWRIVSCSIFGASLVLLYSASALYHLSQVSPEAKKILKRIDHMMIFVFIAGTYTPFCLLPLRGGWGWTIFGIVWGAVFFGIFVKLFWIHAGRWISTSIYLFVGWVAIIAIFPIVHALSSPGLFWLVAGGLFYTAGAIIYGLKRPDPFPNIFGFHEIWHLFVLAGSFSHVLSVATVI